MGNHESASRQRVKQELTNTFDILRYCNHPLFGETVILINKNSDQKESLSFIKEMSFVYETEFHQSCRLYEERLQLKQSNFMPVQSNLFDDLRVLHRIDKCHHYNNRNLIDAVVNSNENKSHLPEELMWSILKGITEALQYLSSNNIIHANIPLQYLLRIHYNNKWYQLHLLMFYLLNATYRLRFLQQDLKQTNTTRHSYCFFARFQSLRTGGSNWTQNTEKSDVFSLGMTLLHAGLRSPMDRCYQLQPKPMFLNQVLNEKLIQFRQLYSYALSSVVFSMVILDELKRPNCTDLLRTIKIINNYLPTMMSNNTPHTRSVFSSYEKPQHHRSSSNLHPKLSNSNQENLSPITNMPQLYDAYFSSGNEPSITLLNQYIKVNDLPKTETKLISTPNKVPLMITPSKQEASNIPQQLEQLPSTSLYSHRRSKSQPSNNSRSYQQFTKISAGDSINYVSNSHAIPLKITPIKSQHLLFSASPANQSTPQTHERSLSSRNNLQELSKVTNYPHLEDYKISNILRLAPFQSTQLTSSKLIEVSKSITQSSHRLNYRKNLESFDKSVDVVPISPIHHKSFSVNNTSNYNSYQTPFELNYQSKNSNLNEYQSNPKYTYLDNINILKQRDPISITPTNLKSDSTQLLTNFDDLNRKMKEIEERAQHEAQSQCDETAKVKLHLYPSYLLQNSLNANAFQSIESLTQLPIQPKAQRKVSTSVEPLSPYVSISTASTNPIHNNTASPVSHPHHQAILSSLNNKSNDMQPLQSEKQHNYISPSITPLALNDTKNQEYALINKQQVPIFAGKNLNLSTGQFATFNYDSIQAVPSAAGVQPTAIESSVDFVYTDLQTTQGQLGFASPEKGNFVVNYESIKNLNQRNLSYQPTFKPIIQNISGEKDSSNTTQQWESSRNESVLRNLPASIYNISPIQVNNNNSSYFKDVLDFNRTTADSRLFVENRKQPVFKQVESLLEQPTFDKQELAYVVEDYDDGSRYEGEKLNNLREGSGQFYYRDGGMYDGEWHDDAMHGRGLLFYPDGKIAYEGTWESDQFNGVGTLYNQHPMTLAVAYDYRNFDEVDAYWIKYDGEFKLNQKAGFGILYVSNGERFEGMFKDNLICGIGTYFKMNGEAIEGEWINNQLRS